MIVRCGLIAAVSSCVALGGCGGGATSRRAADRGSLRYVPAPVCAVDRVLAAGARAAAQDDPNLAVGKLAADGGEMSGDPARFAAFVAPIAVRLADNETAVVRALEHLPDPVRVAYSPGEFALFLTLEERERNDLDALATRLARVSHQPTAVAETRLADVEQLYAIDGSAADRTAIGLGVTEEVLAGGPPTCSARDN